MDIEFEGENLSLWMSSKGMGLATGNLPEMGAFFPIKFSIPQSLTYSDGSPISVNEKTMALGIYEMDQEIIAQNVQEEHFDLEHSVRLFDTRYGLFMYLKWKLSPNRPQETSVEHFLNMHSREVINTLENMCKQEFFFFGYCDFHAQKVVRSCLMPSESFLPIGVVAGKAAQLIDTGQIHSEDCDPQRATQEIMDYVDEHPLSEITVLPERTY